MSSQMSTCKILIGHNARLSGPHNSLEGRSGSTSNANIRVRNSCSRIRLQAVNLNFGRGSYSRSAQCRIAKPSGSNSWEVVDDILEQLEVGGEDAEGFDEEEIDGDFPNISTNDLSKSFEPRALSEEEQLLLVNLMQQAGVKRTGVHGVDEPSPGRYRGWVKFFHSDKGFGMIVPDDKETFDEKDIFVHHTAVNATGRRLLLQGEKVEFAFEETEEGRFNALEVTAPNHRVFKSAHRVKGVWTRKPMGSKI